jgi:BirA family biotin operon repressor/biotin-[acetyl-CoA-carboxylase] ligase
MLASNSEPLAEGTVIMADDQFAGRGQQEMSWVSAPKKNLTVSLFLKPSFLKINEQFLLNMLVCLAIKQALEKYITTQIAIKWPNDIYLGNRKLGGILIENNLSGTVYKSAIIGIGLNVNQQVFPPEIQSRAVSLHQILQEDVNLVQLLAEICSHIESGYLKLRTGNYPELKEGYLANLYNFNQTALYKQDGVVFEGKILDVTEEGLLLVLQNGIIRQYNFKELQYIHET